MTLSIGQVLKGRAASYHIIKVLKAPMVFQAKIVPLELHSSHAQFAMIKHFPDDMSKTQYDRELHAYSLPSIAKSPYIRSMLETIGHDEPASVQTTSSPLVQIDPQPQCMVFEWMDTDLWQLPSKPFRSGSELPRIVARSLLHALEVFEYEDGVHTDLNPNNVFLSNFNGEEPVVKLGDLGNAVGIGPRDERPQGVVIRAPEVWKGITATPKADIWSLGVTLAHWLAGTVIFGPHDKIIQDFKEHWCIAKIIRLTGHPGPPDPSKIEIVDEFALAEYLESSTFVRRETGIEERYIKVGTIRQELNKVEGPIDPGAIRFIESLLVVDPLKRPSAKEALLHPWLTGEEDEGGDSDWSVD